MVPHMELTRRAQPMIEKLARAGLVAKGLVYVVSGLLAFMAAFDMGRQSADDAGRSGVLRTLQELPAGDAVLGLLCAGLVAYSLWRFVQALAPHRHREMKWYKRLRYLFSGLVYLSLAFTAGRMALHEPSSGGHSSRDGAQWIMDKPFGAALLGLVALAFLAAGIYQAWYGFSEKYRKHVEGLSLRSEGSSLLLRSGKIGYIARGIVWLLLAWLLANAALHANAAEAGGTEKAFRFIEASKGGSLLLGALGIGLVAYGLFNFVRARYEHFD